MPLSLTQKLSLNSTCTGLKFSKFFMAVNSFYYFQTFVIAEPAVIGNGATGTIGSSLGDCATDRFSVTAGGSGTGSPIICGTNTGQHGEYHLKDHNLFSACDSHNRIIKR